MTTQPASSIIFHGTHANQRFIFNDEDRRYFRIVSPRHLLSPWHSLPPTYWPLGHLTPSCGMAGLFRKKLRIQPLLVTVTACAAIEYDGPELTDGIVWSSGRAEDRIPDPERLRLRR
jgi:hypothetical protein